MYFKKIKTQAYLGSGSSSLTDPFSSGNSNIDSSLAYKLMQIWQLFQLFATDIIDR